MNKLNKDRTGIATIIILLVVVVVIAGAGVAVYVAVSGSDNSNDDNSVIAGPSVGSSYVYKAADGSTLKTEVIGNSGDKTIFNVKLKSTDGDTFLVVNKSDGKLNTDEGYTSSGSGDDLVLTWNATISGKSVEVSTKKIDGAYAISDLKVSGTVYAYDSATSNVKITTDAPSENVGESYEYSYKLSVESTFDGKTTKAQYDGKITISCIADSAGGKYVFTVKTDIKWPDGVPDSVKEQYGTSATVEYYISTTANYNLFGDSLKQLKDVLDGSSSPGTSDSDTKVYKYNTSYSNYLGSGSVNLSLEIGSTSGVLYNYSLAADTSVVLDKLTTDSHVLLEIKLTKHTH